MNIGSKAKTEIKTNIFNAKLTKTETEIKQVETLISLIFTNSYNSSFIPSAWKSSYVCLIYKGSGSHFLPENY